MSSSPLPGDGAPLIEHERTMPERTTRGFGSDNHAGVHPAVLDAIVAANVGHALAYGGDPHTARALEVLCGHFGADCDIAFTFNGTGANVVCLSSACRPWESVLCPATAHINVDECGAPERIGSLKLIGIETADGKLTPELASPYLIGFGNEHHVQPRVLSISQITEYGTIYTAEEIRALSDLAHSHGMLLHMDGARLANAAVALDATLREITVDAGVDLLSLGGTKNGMLAGEAVVLFGAGRSDALPFVRKQSGQLPSKMRFVAAQFTAMYEGDLWRECAGNANSMAARLAEGLRDAGFTLTQEPQANEVFALLPPTAVVVASEQYRAAAWQEASAGSDVEVRFVASWDTTADDVDAVLDALITER
ncbi:MAG: threonine aldolase [Actinobacteria bacterium HGW-Actinobacteria-10]|nr:MAG: threonine aldolase [Actinobacteria bacterium HGW-Actinobacteria-10]